MNDDEIYKIRAWVQNPKNFLVILGPPGTGKTYLVAAIARYFFAHHKDIYIWQNDKFYSRIKKSFDLGGNSSYELEMMLDHDIVILDDIGSGYNTDWQVEQMFVAIDHLYGMETPAIITSNLRFRQRNCKGDQQSIEAIFGDRTRSRLQADENTYIGLWDRQDLRATKGKNED